LNPEDGSGEVATGQVSVAGWKHGFRKSKAEDSGDPEGNLRTLGGQRLRSSTHHVNTISGFNQLRELSRIVVEARENRAQLLRAEVLRDNLAQHGAEVRRQREVASFVQLLGR